MNMKEKGFHRGTSFLLSFLMLFILFSFHVEAAGKTETNMIRVGWYEDSYHITGTNGERSGYGYEYEQSLASYTGWNYKYIKDDWSKLIEMLQSGKIDLMGGISYTDERAETMLFSDLPMGTEKYYLYADLANSDISASDLTVGRNNTDLMAILNKTLQAMQSSMLTGALSMYDNASKKVTLADFIKDNLLVVASVFTLLFLLILFVILQLLRKARVAEEKAKEAQIQAENANAAKSTFLFNMSHDIRTPMNALLGYNQLMKKELTDSKLLDYQEKIEQAGNLLLSIINNVLDMARIESGKMELDENYSKVGDILKDVCEVFDVEAKKKGIRLTYETQVTHKHILCDVTNVQKILMNLVSNAVKYTPSGGTITIKSQELPCDKEGYTRIKTEVVDNGIGISKEYLPLMFDSFSRERNTTIGKIGGTGLGMSIVKKLVDMMGGSIAVESELGKGSRFTLILEQRIADENYYEQKTEETSADGKEILQGKRILLAEDNELNAEIAIAILEDMGLKVERVEDGIQCISQIEKMPSGSYDVILMDIQMPHMDGYKATETIRSLPDKEKANIPIVAMTANAFEEDRKTAFDKGMNEHIAKPIDVEKVEKVLLAILR